MDPAPLPHSRFTIMRPRRAPTPERGGIPPLRIDDFDVSFTHTRSCTWATAVALTAMLAGSGLIAAPSSQASTAASAKATRARDTLGCLTRASNRQGHSYAYTYDANGNRTSAKKDGATIQTLTYNADNQISSSGRVRLHSALQNLKK